MKKRLLSLALCLALCLGLFPFGVLAEESGETATAVVAMIGDEIKGDNMYTTLAAAIAAAQPGDKIKLLGDDISENITVDSGEFVIDLSGKTWSSTSNPPLTINGGKVTVQNGAIAAPDGDGAAPAIIVKAGTLTIGEKMVLTGGTPADDDAYPALQWNDGEVNPIPVGTKLNNGIEIRKIDPTTAESYTLSVLLPEGTAFSYGSGLVNSYEADETQQTITVVEHTKHDLTDSPECACGYRCPHPNFDTNGECITCALPAAAMIGNTYYGSLQAALDKAGETGGTVKLFRDLSYAYDGDIYARSANTVTLDLNGLTMEYLAIGDVREEVQYDEDYGYYTEEVIKGPGSLTVINSGGSNETDDGRVGGSILSVDLYSGVLNLESGQLGSDRYRGIVGGYDEATANIFGGTVIGVDVRQGDEKPVTVNVTGGEHHSGAWSSSETASFNISGGSFDAVQFCDADTGAFHISGGTFGTIGAYKYSQAAGDTDVGTPLYNILASGSVFYNADGTIVSSAATELKNVTVKSDHTHNMHKDDNGNWVCDCGFTCDHAKIDETTGLCPTCGTQFIVKATATDGAASYYTSLSEAANNAPDNSTLTLLTEVKVSNLLLESNRTVTLDWNGKKSSAINVASKYGDSYTLTAVGEGYFSSITAINGAKVDLSQWTGSIGELTWDSDSTVTLPTNCTIYKLTVDEATGTWSLLPKGYAFKNTKTGELMPYQYELGLPGEYVPRSIYDLQVVQCTDHSIGTDGHCIYCNAYYEASVDGVFYDSLGKALSNWTSGTLKLYADAPEQTWSFESPTAVLTLDLNGHHFNTTQTKGISLNGSDLTVIDTSENQNGRFGHLDVRSGKLTLESGILSNLYISELTKAEISLVGGKLEGGRIAIPLYKLLPNGYTLKNNNNFSEAPGTILEQFTSSYTVEKVPITITVIGEPTITIPYGRTTSPFKTPTYELTEGSDKVSLEKSKFEWYAMINGKAVKLEDALKTVSIGDKLDVFYSFMLENDQYGVLWETHAAPYTITIGKADLADAEITLVDENNDTLTSPLVFQFNSDCTGKTQTQNIKVTLNGNEVPSSEYTVTGNTAADAGTHTLTVTAKEDSDTITGSKDYNWSIAPYEFDEAVVELSKQYDGTTAVTNATVLRFQRRIDDYTTQVVILPPTDYEVTASSDYPGAAAGNYDGMKATVTLKNSNYTFKGGANTWTGAVSSENCYITWATAPEAPQATLSVVNGGGHTYTLDVSKYLPTLPSGCEFGTIKYELFSSGIQLDSNYYQDAEVSADGKLTLNIRANMTQTEGSVGTIKVSVNSQNYRLFNIIIKVQAVNQKAPELDGDLTLSRNYLTYGEPLSNITILGGTMKDADGNPVPGTFRWSDGDVTPDAQDEYRAEWDFYPNDDIYYAGISSSTFIKVNKANSSTIAPTTLEPTYNGHPQALVGNDGHAIGGELVYSLTEDGKYTTTLPTATNAGSYTIWFKAVGDRNHNDTAPNRIDTFIARKPLTAPTIEVAPGSAYNGQPQEPAVTVKDGDTSIPTSEYTVSYDNNTNAGTATVTITDAEGGNYIVSGSTKFTIAKAAPTYTAPTANTLTYNGGKQELISAGSTKDGNMVYSLAEEGEYSETVPSAVNADGYVVWYKVLGDKNHNDTTPASVKVSIGQKDITNAVITLDNGLTYNGTAQEQKIASVTIDGLAVTYTVSDNTGTNAGNYTLTITGTGNFTGTATKAFTIAKAASSCTSPELKELTYNGKEQELIAAPTTSDGTMQYKLGDGQWQNTIPKATNAGKYDVYYRVKGDSNHNDSNEGHVNVSIAAKDIQGATIKLGDALTYNDKEQTQAVTSVTIDDLEATYDVSGNTGTDAGDYTLTVTGKGNFTGTVEAKFTIAKAEQAITAADISATYGDTDKAVDESGTFGAVTYGSSNADVVTVGENGKLTFLKSGTATITISAAGDDNYKAGSKSITVTVAKKALTIKANDKSAYVGSTAPDLTTVTEKDYTVTGLVREDKLENITVKLAYADDLDMTKTGTCAIKATVDGTDDRYSFTTEDGTLTITTRPSSGGSGSTGTKTDTVKNPDGSTTKTETKSDGSKTETTTATTPGGSTGSTVTKTDAKGNSKTEASAKLSDKDVKDAQEKGEAVTVPVKDIEAGKDSNSATEIKIDVPKNSGKTTVEIPVDNVTSGTVAVIVHPDGTEEIAKNSKPTEDGVQLEIDSSTTVKIIDNSKDFIDTRDHWSRDEVNFVAARELFNGVGDNRFGVSQPMTRGMVNTVLARLSGVDTTPGQGQTWYEIGTEWAKKNGISDGTNPTGNVTREQLATLLYRYAGSPDVSGSLGFADASSVSDYAKNALLWANQNGIVSGVGSNTIAPKANAQRAQVAAMFARYLKGL